MASSNPSYLPKISSPKPLLGKLRIQHVRLEETNSVHGMLKVKSILKYIKIIKYDYLLEKLNV